MFYKGVGILGSSNHTFFHLRGLTLLFPVLFISHCTWEGWWFPHTTGSFRCLVKHAPPRDCKRSQNWFFHKKSEEKESDLTADMDLVIWLCIMWWGFSVNLINMLLFQPLDLCSRALILSEEMILHESKHHSLKVNGNYYIYLHIPSHPSILSEQKCKCSLKKFCQISKRDERWLIIFNQTEGGGGFSFVTPTRAACCHSQFDHMSNWEWQPFDPYVQNWKHDACDSSCGHVEAEYDSGSSFSYYKHLCTDLALILTWGGWRRLAELKNCLAELDSCGTREKLSLNALLMMQMFNSPC